MQYTIFNTRIKSNVRYINQWYQIFVELCLSTELIRYMLPRFYLLLSVST